MISLPLALLQTADPQLPPTSDGVFFLFTLIKMVVIFTVYMITVAMLTLAERRISAWIQDRQGPNRVGYGGLLQPAADGVKNFMKEETYPAEAYTPLFVLAPALTFIPALLTWAVIPFASPMPTRWGVINLQLADIPVGFLFILAIGSLGVYGIVLAGWSSNNKYALLGGLRSSAQMISYEIAMGMSLIPVLLIAGNVTLTSIVRQQATMGWNVILLSVSFFVFLVAAFAETNRLPFDLPEAESELIAGYHTEYSGMKFSMFMIGEYANMLTASALISTIFFGGWDIPFTTWDNVAPFSKLKTILTLGAMITKVLFFCFFYIWIRWTLPRFRYDQLMSLGWKFMLPLALTYIVVVASATLAFDALGLQRGSYAYLGALGALNLVLLVALFVGLDRGRLISPAYGRTRRPQLAQLQAVYKRTGAMVPPLAPEPGD